MLDIRARTLLKTLIERYIAEGQPVGSRTLSKVPGLELSPATIRNVMADLEDAGLIVSPHTSAGRVPTPRGYRLFVDTLLTFKPVEGSDLSGLRDALQADHPRRMINHASQLLSDLTRFAGVVVAPRRGNAGIRQIEFVSLSEWRILLIIVTDDGDVQNRILHTQRSYSTAELIEASNWLNQNCLGQTFEKIRGRLKDELNQLSSDMSELMAAALEFGQAAGTPADDYIVSGEKNLLEVDEFSTNMARLRELFALFEQRTALAHLLDLSSRAEGVQVFIGSESGISTLDECSVIAAPFEVDGQLIGTVGVVGPTRMAYERVIPIVDITARLLSSALSSP